MAVVVFFQISVGVAVDRFLRAVGVGMDMSVGVLVAVEQITMPMLVGMNMGMEVGMLQRYSILHHQHRSYRHDSQAYVKLYSRPLP